MKLIMILLLQLILTSLIQCDNITIGILSSDNNIYEKFVYRKTIDLAFKENEIPGLNISYHIQSTYCNAIQIAGKTSDFIYKEGVTAIIGPGCGNCKSAMRTAAYRRRLLISYSCTDIDSNYDIFPYFLRTKPFARGHNIPIANKLAVMALKYKWKLLGIIFSTPMTNTKNEIQKSLENRGFTVRIFAAEGYGSITKMLDDVKNSVRIVLLLCPTEMLSNILSASYSEGIHSSKMYQYITIDVDALTLEEIIHKTGEVEGITTGLIDIGARMGFETQSFLNFLQKIKTSFFDKFDTENPFEDADHMTNLYQSASYIYDAILVYMQTLKKISNDIKEYKIKLNDTPSLNGTSSLNGTTGLNITRFLNQTSSNDTALNDTIHQLVLNTEFITKYIKQGTFNGITGQINIGINGARTPQLKIKNILSNYSQVIYDGHWVNENILWLGGSYEIPKDIPECGFDGKCPIASKTTMIVAISIPCALLLLLLVYQMYKAQKYENDIGNKISIISFDDIKVNALLSSKKTREHILNEKSTVHTVTGTKTCRVYYNSKKVMLKKLAKKVVLMNREIMIEVKTLRDLNHQNINQFIGITVQSPNICIVQGFCKKGSLYDVLNNDEIRLDWVFKHSFIWDILNGMIAIHDSRVKVHGHLTSRNCLVNHRWVLEISDFGLREFKEIKNIKEIPVQIDTQARYEQLLWTAPENISFPHKISRAGDVYSFGIIMSEVINRQSPFAAFDDMRPSDIIHYVKKRCIPPFRPHVTLQTGLDPKLINLMKKCWSEEAEDRPLFKEMKPLIKTIRGEGVDILDNMIDMMEKYSKTLDKSVKERTEMFKKEKVKSNELLYRCIPKPLANELLEGNPIVPYDIPLATLMIFKIHNFTNLLDYFDPQQIIDILNDFYRMTEKVMDQHTNVYKIMVDREEYIFCSNVAESAEIADANFLACLAIKLAKTTAKFNWRHVASEGIKLQFKITLHTGPGNGVVVGNKIPVYTLLGRIFDYIRTLTRYTPANKIVVTEECGEILRSDEDFLWEEIGEVECKDIGFIQPKFLVGSKKLGKIFPEVIQSNSEEEPEEQPEEEEEEKTEDVPISQPPKKKERLPYWNVSSTVQTAFDEWFAIKAVESLKYSK